MAESQLAIDIHINKLLDWLIDRRHCTRQWQDAASHVRHCINEALKDMPESEEIANILRGSYINYFHCRDIVTVLRSTEASSKNLFGRYSSQRMHDWNQVISLYEKDGLFLAESASILRRIVCYEIPALKRQAEKMRKAQEECTRKERDYLSAESEWREKYKASCKALGIEGVRVRAELLALVRDLPSTLNAIAENSKQLAPSVEYYKQFTAFMCQREQTEQQLPLLCFVQQRGDVTSYEYRTGKVPTRIDKPELVEEEEVKEEEGDEIDWGALNDETSASGDVIDFGSLEIVDGETVVAENIDFGDDSPPVLELNVPSAEDTGLATGSDALSLLEAAHTRATLVDELLELSHFLRVRAEQTAATAEDLVAASLMQGAPQQLQLDQAQIESWRADVTSLEQQLTSEKICKLFMIRSSPRYVERVADSLQQKLRQADMCAANARLMVEHRKKAEESEVALGPQISSMRDKMKILQRQLEKEISRKYKDRPVNIMGEINTV